MQTKKITRALIPPYNWRMAVAIAFGVLVGIGATAIHLSNFTSYLYDDPATCVNCHLMTPHYATWMKGSHGGKVTCNDCHVPHDNIFNTYYFKAKDGTRHAYVFTTRTEPEIIAIKEAGIAVVQENCKRCHDHQINSVTAGIFSERSFSHGGDRLCWDCHREIPHGRINSQMATPYATFPDQNTAIPEWIKNLQVK